MIINHSQNKRWKLGDRPAPLAIVMEPTRELCLQVYDQGRKLADGKSFALITF